MLISIQFPLADSRGFLPDSGRLAKPAWLVPRPDVDFVRHFGAVRLRPSGGLSGWVGENEICEAKRSISFSENLVLKCAEATLTLPFRVVFRRFFFDGHAVGKFELGLATNTRRRIRLRIGDVKNLVDQFLQLKVRIRNRPDRVYHVVPLGQAGEALAQSYLLATTRKRYGGELKGWFVRSGAPLVFLEWSLGDDVPLPYYARRIHLPSHLALELSYCQVPFNDRRFRIWCLSRPSSSTNARRLRIYLQRLNAEHECLRLILRNIMEASLGVSENGQASNALQQYFNEATRRIGILERKSSSETYDDVGDIARASMDVLYPGRLDSLRRAVESLNMRPAIQNKVIQYIDSSEGRGLLIQTERLGAVVVQGSNSTIAGSAFGNDASVTADEIVGKENKVGDTINISGGDFRGSNINIKSTLQRVSQTIRALPSADDTAKAELEKLMVQLNDVLQQHATKKPEDTEAILEMAKDLIEKANTKKPNKTLLAVSAKGLREAAEAIKDVVPIAISIIKTVAGFAGIPVP